jgi:hypothetical protein
MRFHVVGADKESGNDIEIDVTAIDRAEAEHVATKRGLLVSAIEPIKEADPEKIDLVDLDLAPAPKRGAGATKAPAGDGAEGSVDPSMKQMAARASSGTVAGASVVGAAGASAAGASAAGASVAGTSVAGASAAGAPASEAEAHGSISGAVGASTSQPGAHMEYHIIMNQSLYLLEVAVNKHLKDGWEPAGGLTVGISNNAMQYFQAMIRHKD